MWVLDIVDDKLYAYTLKNSGATYNPNLDLTLVDGAAPGGIWSDGTHIWVVDFITKYGHAYDLPVDLAGSLTVSNSSNVPTVGSPMTVTLSDPDGGVGRLSWQWARTADKTNFTDIAGATDASYTPRAADVGKFLRVTASYDDAEAPDRTTEGLLDCPVVAAVETSEAVKRSVGLHCYNGYVTGIWADETTMWVADTIDNTVYVYDLTGSEITSKSGITYESGVTHDPARSFDLAPHNGHPSDLWSDGTTLWIVDTYDVKLYAYTLGGAGATYDSTKDITLDQENANPRGIWSDGTNLWVADNTDNKVYAYTLTSSGATYNPDGDFVLKSGTGHPRDLWSDGTTMWVVSHSNDRVYAYTLTDARRHPQPRPGPSPRP